MQEFTLWLKQTQQAINFARRMTRQVKRRSVFRRLGLGNFAAYGRHIANAESALATARRLTREKVSKLHGFDLAQWQKAVRSFNRVQASFDEKRES